jgi:hypothetical protein
LFPIYTNLYEYTLNLFENMNTTVLPLTAALPDSRTLPQALPDSRTLPQALPQTAVHCHTQPHTAHSRTPP